MADVAIVGAGIAGLTAAYRLEAQGVSVEVFEASDEVGGAIRSTRENGYLVEHGPNTLQSSTDELDQLIGDLQLEDEVLTADKSVYKRYIVLGNTPVAVPQSPLDVMSTPLLSPWAKVRLLVEPIIRKQSGDVEESVSEFVERRLGREVLEYGINPFVAGVFAGDPDVLSLPHAFPQLHKLEQHYGSVIVGQILGRLARKKSNGKSKTSGIFSFKDGVQTLPRTIKSKLDGAVHLNAPVTSIRPKNEKWQLSYSQDQRAHQKHFDAVVYAAPLHALRSIDFPVVDEDSILHDVDHPPISVITLGFPKEAISHPLDGFGLLVPEIEDHLRILGTLFPSTVFPGRAPEGHHLLVTYLGGSRHPELASGNTTDLVRIVRQDLGRILGISGTPHFVHRVFWKQAIPQYSLGYGKIKDNLKQIETRHPNLRFAGNYRSGISVGAAASSGAKAANTLAETIQRDATHPEPDVA